MSEYVGDVPLKGAGRAVVYRSDEMGEVAIMASAGGVHVDLVLSKEAAYDLARALLWEPGMTGADWAELSRDLSPWGDRERST